MPVRNAQGQWSIQCLDILRDELLKWKAVWHKHLATSSAPWRTEQLPEMKGIAAITRADLVRSAMGFSGKSLC